jgi:hypothetical protein
MFQEHPNPFRTKLTFAARCAIFAGHWHKSYNYPELALAFGVNEETIGKICRANGRSRHYKDVFRESNNLGVERMWEQYSEKIDIEKRIENARMERGTRNPHIPEYYVDTGPGTYYLKNSKGVLVAVKIKHGSEIMKLHPGEDYNENDGFMYWSPKWKRWARNTDEPWETINDVLRYFAAFPDELDDL